mmetsp:Transcript_17923/g.61091  ORF Transcript_17923/g.61091 Transcript_17923/m.61091 type:complete len:256 (-) Transcript_17923:34-801(-)
MGGSKRPRSARENHSTKSVIDTNTSPFAQGAFRNVYKGRYTEGKRKGEPCVSKVFKSGSVFEDSFFHHDIQVVEKALDIIDRWNAKRFVDKQITLNRPEVWTFTFTGQKNLVEPFIQNWEKFNSNSGWAKYDTPWHLIMQALSHYSYDVTSGQCVLCDLQGGVYADGVVLTDPVILSRNQSYGPTDLGAEGISTFFSKHRCNQFCRAQWQKPRDKHAYFRPQVGTSMVHNGQKHAPTRNTRPRMTHERQDSDSDS